MFKKPGAQGTISFGSKVETKGKAQVQTHARKEDYATNPKQQVQSVVSGTTDSKFEAEEIQNLKIQSRRSELVQPARKGLQAHRSPEALRIGQEIVSQDEDVESCPTP
jgi:hypothetical protein